MASSSLFLSPPSLFPFPQSQPHSINGYPKTILRSHPLQTPPLLQASKRFSNFPQESDAPVGDFRNWSRNRGGGVVSGEYEEDDDDDEDGDDEEDRSLDLLVRFVQNVFKKVSKKARRAVRSVLPVPISTKLVGFSVNGVIMLAFLWVLKAFLEVVCTLGSVVFVSILLIRGIWSGVSYLQESRGHKRNDFDDEHHVWSGARPAT
ncbi:hypothetical protein L1049_015100 [Liquidambar formosana]|uniref:Uncharacterized protein n=1 Tax=Liquidambar formosana TaxID=63359 RepID=A0AAP0S441_LIQFO